MFWHVEIQSINIDFSRLKQIKAKSSLKTYISLTIFKGSYSNIFKGYLLACPSSPRVFLFAAAVVAGSCKVCPAPKVFTGCLDATSVDSFVDYDFDFDFDFYFNCDCDCDFSCIWSRSLHKFCCLYSTACGLAMATPS